MSSSGSQFGKGTHIFRDRRGGSDIIVETYEIYDGYLLLDIPWTVPPLFTNFHNIFHNIHNIFHNIHTIFHNIHTIYILEFYSILVLIYNFIIFQLARTFKI